MEREKLLANVAPCSLLCYTCMGFRDGAMADCARRLYRYNEGVGAFRGQFMDEAARAEWDVFFDGFRGTLKEMGAAGCPGCREAMGQGRGCIPGCVIPACAEARGVDYCTACEAFPCEAAQGFFQKHAGKAGEAWLAGSRRIRAVGVEAYFNENKDESHYAAYAE